MARRTAREIFAVKKPSSSTQDIRNYFAYKLVALAMIAIAMMAIIYSLKSLINTYRSSRWVQVRGLILYHKLYTPSSIPTRGYKLKSTQAVVYNYKYDNAVYTNDLISFGIPSEGQRRLDPLKVGESVTVYVNPSHPRESVLVQLTWRQSGMLFITCGGLLVLVCGALLANAVWRR